MNLTPSMKGSFFAGIGSVVAPLASPRVTERSSSELPRKSAAIPKWILWMCAPFRITGFRRWSCARAPASTCRCRSPSPQAWRPRAGW